MNKSDKVKIIKWYISNYCGLGNIQTLKNETDDLHKLEMMVMNDRTYPNYGKCSTCWHQNKDYYSKCIGCHNSDEKGGYTFPYGYWKNFYDRENNC